MHVLLLGDEVVGLTSQSHVAEDWVRAMGTTAARSVILNPDDMTLADSLVTTSFSVRSDDRNATALARHVLPEPNVETRGRKESG